MNAALPRISFDAGERLLNWHALAEALVAGHQHPRAEIADVFLQRGSDTLLNRSAWIKGLGALVKVATVFPGNAAQGLPAVNGLVTLFSDRDGTPEALVDFHLVTKWKTAADSLLGALRLANPEAREILIVGAGTVAASLVEAFSTCYPKAQIRIWNRSGAKARTLAAGHPGVLVADALEPAARQADIILTCTLSQNPVIKGAWLRPGQHVNLIGAFRDTMREADDHALARAEIYADSFATTVDHIGEFKIPLASGALKRSDLRADFYDLDRFQTFDPDRITLFKNGGGAHLDLMVAHHILSRWRAAGNA